MVLIAQKSKKEKENNSGGKTKIDDYFGSTYKKESELYIRNYDIEKCFEKIMKIMTLRKL